MKNNFFTEIVFSVILLIVLIILANPFDVFMPPPIYMSMSIVLALVFILFAGFMWKEQVADEREGLHRYIAARYAYLAGTAVLTAGVIVQTFRHILDPWLVTALVVMLLAKIAGLVYGQLKH